MGIEFSDRKSRGKGYTTWAFSVKLNDAELNAGYVKQVEKEIVTTLKEASDTDAVHNDILEGVAEELGQDCAIFLRSKSPEDKAAAKKAFLDKGVNIIEKMGRNAAIEERQASCLKDAVLSIPTKLAREL